MMNILVVSDTHGRYLALEEVFDRQFGVDEKFRPSHLIHLGDGISDIEGCKRAERLCVHTVRGNCDDLFFSMANGIPKERLLELYGYKILVMHGDRYSVKSGDVEAIEHAATCGADILMYGHTHIATSYTLKKGTRAGNAVLEKDMLVFNPGSLGYSGSFSTVTLSEKGILSSHGSIK